MMDFEKLDIVDEVIVDSIYQAFIQNKRFVGFIPMHNKPINADKLDTSILESDEEMVDFIINLSFILHDGPTKGEYTYMDIIYTKVEEDILVCAVYQQKHQEYLAIFDKDRTIMVNGFKNEECYFKFYNLINVMKDLYYL